MYGKFSRFRRVKTKVKLFNWDFFFFLKSTEGKSCLWLFNVRSRQIPLTSSIVQMTLHSGCSQDTGGQPKC